ncbi:MAG: hydrolase 1, exosortase A system-associated [Sphingomonadales bacterium]|nr:hydrolase 1, exosortase A system-associated [Sphingomonadales bacterium]
MMRRHVLFPCEGAMLAGTLDEAAGSTGLLVVSGGNELRSGAWSGQAQFAARIAAEGFPVFRFDRRGVGDSEGYNFGFTDCAADLAAALAAFREEAPQVTRVVAWGNCDAASALMLGGGAGCQALVLSNPWTIEDETATPPAEVVRDHYKRRFTDPAALRRVLTGQVNVVQALKSLLGAAKPAPAPVLAGLVGDMAEGIAGFTGTVRFPIAERDRTGQAFLGRWQRTDPRIAICPRASHSFVEPEAREWLVGLLLDVLLG